MTIGELLDRIESVIGDLTPGGTAFIDQLGAAVRDGFAELGLPLGDETVATAAVATIGQLLDLVLLCRRVDALSEEEGLAVASVLSILARTLVPFVPEGAR